MPYDEKRIRKRDALREKRRLERERKAEEEERRLRSLRWPGVRHNEDPEVQERRRS
jgi:hypothetical protein